ncbi:MAG: GTPase HflX, partial [Mucinivorans sp.]
PTFMVFNKIDAFTFVPKAEDDLSPLQDANRTLDDLRGSWMASGRPSIFISARQKVGVDRLKGDLYKMVQQVNSGRYPFDNFLW